MSERIFVGTRKGLFTVQRRKAGRWAVAGTAFLGDPVTMTLFDRRDGWAYAAVGHGHFGAKLHRSRDGGKGWEECAAPAYPPPSGGEVWLNPWNQEPIPLKLDTIWALAPGGKDQPGTLWCGTLPGGLFRSNDRGSSWDLMGPLWNHPDRKRWAPGGALKPGIHSVLMDPGDSRRVAVGVSCGGVWVTENGGETWECRAKGMRAAYMPPEQQYDPVVQDPHIVVQCAAKPDFLWCQHHNGIFRSRDAGRNWEEITDAKPSVFGFAVAVHPRDPETAWFVPAIKDEKRIPVDGKVVVSRTRDGGKTFEVLRKGLPQEHAYDLTLRHGLDVDELGDRLAFGSTTGSLWVTEDQGDSWQTVAEHLPPVYCVRFG